ncbi:MAG: hypothetical protein MMC23_002821 [Stictis urceolatum]|nr:hypothetical protein [Stictis urceolata]
MAPTTNPEKQSSDPPTRIPRTIPVHIDHSSLDSDADTIHEPSAPTPSSSDIEKQSKHTPTNLLSRTISRTSSLPEPGPPPDGGLQAWTQAFMAHLVIFNTWGYINSYGVFQNYYTATLHHAPSDISWVGSVQIFLLFFIGTFSGRLTDAGYFRPVFTVGSVVQLLGVFLTSLCTRYWQLFLAQGICTGLGNGLLFCPTLALMPTYFTKNRSVAIGIAASGSATGGMIFPAVIERLLPRIGFAWTVRVIAFIMLFTQCIAYAFLKPRLPPRKTGPLVEWGAFKEPPYALFAVGMFLCFWGLYPAFYYVGEFASNVLGLPESDSIYLLLIMNGVGLVGRMLPAYFADKYTGPINLLIPFGVASGVVVYSWTGVHDRGGVFTFAIVYGLFAAGIQSLFPSTLSSLTTDMKKMGVRMGMVFSVISFACLTGSPIAGALITHAEGKYIGAQAYAGTALVAGALTLGLARLSKTGFKLKVRM